MRFFITNLRLSKENKRKYFYVDADNSDLALGQVFTKLKHTDFNIEEAITVPKRIYRSTWTEKQDIPGIYLVMNGSNSVWCGFKTKREAETCLQVLPDWKLLIRK